MIIYKATNNINGKVYIGQTTRTLKERIKGHNKLTKRGTPYFRKAIVKYGINGFKWQTICICSSIAILNEQEIYYIAFYNSTDRNIGYNLTDGGEGVVGFKHSEETKKIIGEASSRRIVTDKTKNKISIANKGRVFSEEHRRKLSENNVGMLGKKHTKESKQKMKDNRIYKKVSKESRKKMSNSAIKRWAKK